MNLSDDNIFFDIEDVEKTEEAEIASEPDAEDEENSPDLREFTPQEMTRMYQENRGLIEREAKYRLSLYRGSHLLVNYDDLIQEGFLGFLQGARKYDETKGASLRTYAGYWVRKRIRQIVKEAYINYQYLDYAADWEHTPWRSGIIMSEAEFTFENDYFRTSARLPVFDSNPEAIVSRREKKSRLRHAIDQCSEREHKYMDYRYGFDGTDGHSWRESRDHFGQYGQRGEDIEFGLRYNMEQRLGYGFYDYAEKYWMPHDSDKSDFKWHRIVPTLENMPFLP